MNFPILAGSFSDGVELDSQPHIAASDAASEHFRGLSSHVFSCSLPQVVLQRVGPELLKWEGRQRNQIGAGQRKLSRQFS